jgi:hypothetical protein
MASSLAVDRFVSDESVQAAGSHKDPFGTRAALSGCLASVRTNIRHRALVAVAAILVSLSASATPALARPMGDRGAVPLASDRRSSDPQAHARVSDRHGPRRRLHARPHASPRRASHIHASRQHLSQRRVNKLHATSARPAPVLDIKGAVLHWTATARSHQYLESRTTRLGTTYLQVARTTDDPPSTPGITVTYRVRPLYQPQSWSNQVTVSYSNREREAHGALRQVESGAGATSKQEKRRGKREATETPSEREAREKAEREAKERVEREAREKAEREAKEKAEREAREKAEREAKERAEREAREKLELEPVLGAVVKALPTGPPTPASGWTVQYADAFATPILGTPQAKGASVVDNTWKVQNSNNGCCSNSNEPNGMRPRQVEVTPEGLKENCVYKPEGITAEGSSSASSRVYECGGLDSAYCCHMGDGEPAGYNTPVFWTGLGQTFAFQAVLKLPPNTGLADPAFWADGPPWTESEMDFPEFYGSCPTCTAATDWTGGANAYYATFGSPHPELVKDGFTNHPDQGFHTYTFYVFPGSNTSKYRFSVYIDGELQTLNGATVSPETSSVAERIGLILDYSLRNANTSAATPAGGSYFARSAAIYEDTAHAGLGIEHGGLAPGTTVVP